MSKTITPRRFYIDHAANDSVIVRSVPSCGRPSAAVRQRAANSHPSHAALLLSLGRLVRSGKLRLGHA